MTEQQGQYGTPQQPRPATTNGFAVASLVLGIVWFGGLGAILALVFGYTALSQINRSAGYEGGRGMAIAGIVLGWIGVAGIVLMITLMGLGVAWMPEMGDMGGMNGEHDH